jgi:repressor LexA
MSSVGDNIRRMRLSCNLTQEELARKLDIKNRATIANWEIGRTSPPHEMLARLANIFMVTVDDILGRRDLPSEFTEAFPGRFIRLPIIGTVKAGINGLAYTDYQGEAAVDSALVANDANYYWFKIKGDSMINDGIRPGDLALVREQPEVDNGDIAVVVINGDEGTVKHLYKNGDSIVLQSANPDYPPRIFSGPALSQVRIVGKVTLIQRKL